MKARNTFFVINILLIIAVCTFIVKTITMSNEVEAQNKDLLIKYDSALEYINQISDLHTAERYKFPHSNVYSIDGDSIGSMEALYGQDRLLLFISSNHCPKCVEFCLSSIPKINDILGNDKLIVLYNGFSDKDLYLWRKDNKIKNLFVNINSLKESVDNQITMPILFTLTDKGDIRYPYAPEKLFNKSLRTYLYTIKESLKPDNDEI